MALLRLFLLSNIGPPRLGGGPGADDVLAEGGREAEAFLEGMAVSELLDYLHGRNINTSACVRKSELVALAMRVAASARPAAAARFARRGDTRSARGAAQFQWEGFLDNNVPMNPPVSVRGSAARSGWTWQDTVEGSGGRGGWGEDDGAEAGLGEISEEVADESVASRAFAEWRARSEGLSSVWQGDSMLAEADEVKALFSNLIESNRIESNGGG